MQRQQPTTKAHVGQAFEQRVGKVFAASGFEVALTPVSNDFGADVIAARGALRMVVQCKLHKGQVSLDAIQEVYTAKAYYCGTHAIVVHGSMLTPQATSLAAALGVGAVHMDRLKELLESDCAIEHACSHEAVYEAAVALRRPLAEVAGLSEQQRQTLVDLADFREIARETVEQIRAARRRFQAAKASAFEVEDLWNDLASLEYQLQHGKLYDILQFCDGLASRASGRVMSARELGSIRKAIDQGCKHHAKLQFKAAAMIKDLDAVRAVAEHTNLALEMAEEAYQLDSLLEEVLGGRFTCGVASTLVEEMDTMAHERYAAIRRCLQLDDAVTQLYARRSVDQARVFSSKIRNALEKLAQLRRELLEMAPHFRSHARALRALQAFRVSVE